MEFALAVQSAELRKAIAAKQRAAVTTKPQPKRDCGNSFFNFVAQLCFPLLAAK